MQGNVTAIETKNGVGRNGPWVLYNVTVDGQKYGAGFDCPPCVQGDFIEFETEQKGQYTNIKNIRKAAAPAGAPAANNSSSGGAAPARIDTRDVSIRYQSSRKDALLLTQVLLENDALAVPAKKAEKADAIMAFVEDVTNQFYVKLQDVMDNGGVSAEDLIPQPENG